MEDYHKEIYFLVELRSELSGEADVHLLLVHGRDGLDPGGAVEDLLGGAHDPLGHDGLLEAHLASPQFSQPRSQPKFSPLFWDHAQ